MAEKSEQGSLLSRSRGRKKTEPEKPEEPKAPAEARTDRKPEVVTREETALTPPANGSNEEAPEIALAKIDRSMATFDSALASGAGFAHYWRIAKLFADSAFVPDHFGGKPGDCLIAIEMATQMREHPLMLMQNLFMVKGRPGWQTQFMIARANRRAGFQSKIRWRIEALEPKDFKGYENIRVFAFATDDHGDLIESDVDTAMAVGENWVKNAKYKTMFRHMMKWRAAAFLIRMYCPEVMMGMDSVEDLEAMQMPEPAPVALPPAAFEFGDKYIPADRVEAWKAELILAGVEWRDFEAKVAELNDGQLNLSEIPVHQVPQLMEWVKAATER